MSVSDNTNDTQAPIDGSAADQGPGCLPGVIAAMALGGIIGFIVCGVSTWVLFQKRTELAIRTIRDAYLPELEQSYLEPESKAAVVDQIEQLADDLERGKYEDWQAAGILQRLQRLPVQQWGELQAIEAFVVKNAPPDQATESLQQLSRLKRAVEIGKATSFDFEEVLTSVHQADASSPNGRRLIQPLTWEAIQPVVQRASEIANRYGVEDQMFDGIAIEEIVRQQITAGAQEGTF